MSICMVGIDHNKANVDIRALFSFTKKNAAAAMQTWKKISGMHGCVVLSPVTGWSFGQARRMTGKEISWKNCADGKRWILPSMKSILCEEKIGKR